MFDLYVINLEERKDKLEHIVNNFSDFNLIRVDAIKHQNGAHGCFLSHKKCIKMAKDKNLKNIIVIEDDCVKNSEINFLNKVTNIMNFLNVYEDWDIFLGASNTTEGKDIIKKISYEKEKIYQINRGFTTHFMIYNYTSYDFFLNADINRCPIDKCWHNNLRALTILPFIAYQLSGISDIHKVHVDYTGIKETECNLISYVKNNNI
jgi:GR25 family glycosyltransferase involved in LPS biosynthesis